MAVENLTILSDVFPMPFRCPGSSRGVKLRCIWGPKRTVSDAFPMPFRCHPRDPYRRSMCEANCFNLRSSTPLGLSLTPNTHIMYIWYRYHGQWNGYPWHVKSLESSTPLVSFMTLIEVLNKKRFHFWKPCPERCDGMDGRDIFYNYRDESFKQGTLHHPRDLKCHQYVVAS